MRQYITAVKKGSRYCSFIILLCSYVAASQEKGTIQTKIVWAEDLIHYQKGYDTFLKKGNLVSFLKTTDSLPSITKKNYENGYYEYGLFRKDLLNDSIKFSLEDWVTNEKLMTDFYYKYNVNTTTVAFNTYWTYYLCEIEFEEYYIGMIEQYVPIFEKKDNMPNLEYETLLLPTYIIKLKSIKPFVFKQQ